MGIETKPLIAIDMDDVLCQTNASVAEWHNETYGTNMNLDLFYCKTHPIITYEMHKFTSPMARLPLLEGMTRKNRFSAYQFLITQESLLGNRPPSVSEDSRFLSFLALYQRPARSRSCGSSSRPPGCGLSIDHRDCTQQEPFRANGGMAR